MSRVCQITGKGPMRGHNVSHANNKTLRRTYPNLQTKRLWVPTEKRWVTLRLSVAALREIEKRGIETVLAEMRRKGQTV